MSPDQLYCDQNLLYPCAPGASYHGRGALPIYWYVVYFVNLLLKKSGSLHIANLVSFHCIVEIILLGILMLEFSEAFIVFDTIFTLVFMYCVTFI